MQFISLEKAPTYALSVVLIVVLRKLYKYVSAKSRRSKLFARLAQFQHNRLQKIQSTSHLKSSLPAEFIKKIICSDAVTLLQLLNEGKVTSHELVLVFYERAITIGQKLGALAEVNIDAALELAKRCDEFRAEIREKDPSRLLKLPLLFGLPISIKSNTMIKGLSTNLGCVNFIDNIPKEDGLIVDILKNQAGAIPFITSNIPQCLMLNETTNRIYGRCKNPWNEKRTSGGSSGGEASLIASGCSPLGLGSDIGGSIRIPCLYTGLYGLKVTTSRLTFEGAFCGNKTNKRGQINIKACHGPIGKTVEDLVLFMRSLFVEDMWKSDPEVVPMQWNDEEYKSTRKMRIGYVEDDKFYAVSPGNKRAVMKAVKALELKGHEMIKLEFPNFEQATIEYFAIMSSAGRFRPYREMMGDESPVPEYNQMLRIMKIPKFLRGIISSILKLKNENRAAKVLPRTNEKSTWEFLKESENQQVIKKEFFDWWQNNKLDALISPGLASPAIKHGESEDAFLSCCYTFLFNLLDYPTGAIPICTVNKDEQSYDDPINKDKYTRKMKESLKATEGLPLGVQVTTLPYKEELCLNVMKQIENAIDFHELPIKF